MSRQRSHKSFVFVTLGLPLGFWMQGPSVEHGVAGNKNKLAALCCGEEGDGRGQLVTLLGRSRYLWMAWPSLFRPAPDSLLHLLFLCCDCAGPRVHGSFGDPAAGSFLDFMPSPYWPWRPGFGGPSTKSPGGRTLGSCVVVLLSTACLESEASSHVCGGMWHVPDSSVGSFF